MKEQLFKMFGEATVKRWVEEKGIRWRKEGSARNSPKKYEYLKLKAQQLIDRKFMYPVAVMGRSGR
jgi:hypothetical protein